MKKYHFFLLVLLVFYSGIILPQYTSSGLEGTHKNAYTVVQPPSIYAHRIILGKTKTSYFQIIYDYPSPPVQAKIAIDYAVNIWEHLINTAISQTIKVRVRWQNLGYSSTAGYTLANCRSDSFYNSPDLPDPDFNYPIALAEYLSDQNLNGDNTEMTVTINSHDSVNWYYGTDGIPQNYRPDLVTTVLHEIAHGLGYTSSFSVDGNYGYFGWDNIPVNINLHPAIYDKFLAVGSNYPNTDILLNYTNGSALLKTKLTSKNIYFYGDNAWMQNGRYNLPELYAPPVWDQGSSISHLDDSTYLPGNSNSLMTHIQDNAEVIHSPGEVGLAILKDMGWTINRLATFTYPGPGIAMKKNTVDTIKWMDNEGGSYSLVLLDSINNLVMTICTLGTADEGYNQYIWNVPASLPNGNYRIKVQFGGAFGITSLFTISDMQQVAAPVFNPEPGNYTSPQTVTCSTTTPGSVIRYTTNGTEPTGSSPVFPASLLVSSQTTIKAKAFKSGMIESAITTAFYSIGEYVPPPEITPISGIYPDGSKWILNWTPGTRCFMNYTIYGNEPADPSLPGHQNEIFSSNPATFTFGGYNVKVKARTLLNETWSSLVERDYVVVPAVRIAQVDDEITGNNSFGKWKNWEGFWKEYPDTIFARPSDTTFFTVQAQQTYKEGTTRKYNLWSDNLDGKYYINHSEITIDQSTSEVLAHFKDTKNASIKMLLENFPSENIQQVSGGYFSFSDPWLINDDSDPRGLRNKGLNADWITKYFPFSVSSYSEYKGVFLDQNPQYNPDIPIYKLWTTDQVIAVNGISRNFYFKNWAATGADFANYGNEIWPVFTINNATITASFKGQGLSSNLNTFSNTSQRKFVRTNNNILYNIYESLDRIWLEKSTDNGTTWIIANQGSPLSNFNYKNPSMCLTPNDRYLFIVCEDNEGCTIRLFQYDSDFDQAIEKCSVYSHSVSETIPVVTDCFNDYSNPTGPVVVWKNSGDDAFGSDPGIYYAAINGNDWTYEEGIRIENTDINSFNPSIAGNDPIHSPVTWKGDPMIFNLAWEQRNGTQSSILYRQAERLDDNIIGFSDEQNISEGCGFTRNTNSSVVTIKDQNEFTAGVCWIGYRNTQAPDGEVPAGETKVFYRANLNPDTWLNPRSYGSDVNSANINKNSNDNSFAFAWSEGSNNVNKYVKSNDITIINNTNTTGRYLQVGNYTGLNYMKLLSFNTAIIPYSFTLSNSFGYQDPPNEPDGTEREGVVAADSVSFYFALGDITINENNIEFIQLPDTITVNNQSVMNSYSVSEPFSLTDNSSFTYGVKYGVTDSSNAAISLNNGKTVSFKVQLIDAGTDEILGNFDNITYNSGHIIPYETAAYQVNTQGIGNRTCKLKLITEANINPGYSLVNSYRTGNNLAKKGFIIRNLEGIETENSYAISQNYPNPFNPSTIIKYQIPRDGHVLIKVHDILGREVIKLVDEEKKTGKYEINFDASNLSSGIYIYRIQAGEYTAIRKMTLIK